VVKLTVEVLGDRVIERRFMRTAHNAADLSEAFEEILDAIETWIGRQFDTQGAEFGSRWEPLTDETIAQKAREGAAEPAQALIRTGALFMSLQGGPGGIRDVGREDAALGTREDTARYHHGRQRSASNPVPRRAIFEPDEIRRRWMLDVLQRAVFDRGRMRL
jgi:hypothetical protein